MKEPCLDYLSCGRQARHHSLVARSAPGLHVFVPAASLRHELDGERPLPEGERRERPCPESGFHYVWQVWEAGKFE